MFEYNTVEFGGVCLFFIYFTWYSLSWVCGLVSVMNFGKFSNIVTSNISSAPFFLSSSFGIPVVCISNVEIFVYVFQFCMFFTDTFLSFIGFLMCYERHSSFLIQCLLFSTLTFYFFLEIPSPCLLYSFILHVVCFFH